MKGLEICNRGDGMVRAQMVRVQKPQTLARFWGEVVVELALMGQRSPSYGEVIKYHTGAADANGTALEIVADRRELAIIDGVPMTSGYWGSK